MKKEVRSNQELGKILKERREKLGITQKELADFCDLSHNGISRIEIGNSDIKLSTLLKMSKIIGINLIIEMED